MNTMNEKKYPTPKFSSAEQEDEYWKTHSLLDEGYEGKIQKTKQKRTSFLSIRLTGEELTRLRDLAARLGLGPSTYARQVLRLELEQNSVKSLPPVPLPSRELLQDEFGPLHERFLEQVREARAAYLETVEHALKELKKVENGE